MGDDDMQTMNNVTAGDYDFDDEAFEEISEEAKDFIRKLLIKDKGYVRRRKWHITSSHLEV